MLFTCNVCGFVQFYGYATRTNSDLKEHLRFSISVGKTCVKAVTAAVDHYAHAMQDAVSDVVPLPVSAEDYVRDIADRYDSETGDSDLLETANYVRGIVDSILSESAGDRCAAAVRDALAVYGVDADLHPRYCREFVRLCYLRTLKRHSGHDWEKTVDSVYAMMPSEREGEFVIRYSMPCRRCRFVGFYRTSDAPYFLWDHIIHGDFKCHQSFRDAQRFFASTFSLRTNLEGLRGGISAVMATLDGMLRASHHSCGYTGFMQRTGTNMNVVRTIALEIVSTRPSDVETMYNNYMLLAGSTRLRCYYGRGGRVRIAIGPPRSRRSGRVVLPPHSSMRAVGAPMNRPY